MSFQVKKKDPEKTRRLRKGAVCLGTMVRGQRLVVSCQGLTRILQIPGRWNFKEGSSLERHKDKIGQGGFGRLRINNLR